MSCARARSHRARTAAFLVLAIICGLASAVLSQPSQPEPLKGLSQRALGNPGAPAPARRPSGKPAGDLVQELLDYAVPPADWREHLRQHQKPRVAPSAGASDDELLEYFLWAPPGETPAEVTRRRLVEICEKEPTHVYALAPFLPTDPQSANRLKQLHDHLTSRRNEDDHLAAESIREWLILHTTELQKERSAWASGKSNNITEEKRDRALQQLIKIDPRTAEKTLRESARSQDPTVRAHALAGLISPPMHYIAEPTRRGWRHELARLVFNAEAPPQAKVKAVLGVMGSGWEEVDEWYLRLFGQVDLSTRESHSMHPPPIGAPAAADPDKWIPKVVSLLERGNELTRRNAAACLVYFTREGARRDALVPLLPWIADPQWVKQHERDCLLYSLTPVNLPEAIPHLRKALTFEKEHRLAAVVEALAHYKAFDAVADLRAIAEREQEYEQRRKIVSALVTLNAFAVDELAGAIRDYAEKLGPLERDQSGNEPWEQLSASDKTVLLSAAHEACTTPMRDETLAAAVVQHVHETSVTNPSAAEVLWTALARWPSATAAEATITRLRTGQFSANWLATLMRPDSHLPPYAENESTLSGLAAGAHAALTAHSTEIENVLGAQDHEAIRALLACARLRRLDLPADKVAQSLENTDPLVAAAADRYLETIDTPSARAELWKRSRGAPRILGARTMFDPEHFTFGAFSKSDERLRHLVMHDPDVLEVHALLSEGYWSDDGQSVLIVKQEHGIVRSADRNGRRREREIPRSQLEPLLEWLRRAEVQDLPPYDEDMADGLELEYVYLSRERGRRVFMNTPPGGRDRAGIEAFLNREPRPDPIIYGELTRRMTRLNAMPMTVIYPTASSLRDFRVLHPQESGKIKKLVLKNGQLRAGIYIANDQPIDWRRVEETGLSKESEPEPPEPRKRDFYQGYLPEDERSVTVHGGPFAGNLLWRGTRMKDDLNGLWLSGATGEPRLLLRGKYGEVVVCPGGEWAVAGKTFDDKSSADRNGVVRIHLPTRRVIPVDLPSQDTFEPLVWIDAHRKVLLYQQRHRSADDTTEPPVDFYLLDPVSGRHEKVEGEFRPFFDAREQALQPTGRLDEFWATLHASIVDPQLTSTTIGRFNTREFRFAPVVTIEDIQVNSASIAVDEPAGVIWANFNGDLVRFGLPQH